MHVFELDPEMVVKSFQQTIERGWKTIKVDSMNKDPKLCVEDGVQGIERMRSTSVQAEDDGLFS